MGPVTPQFQVKLKSIGPGYRFRVAQAAHLQLLVIRRGGLRFSGANRRPVLLQAGAGILLREGGEHCISTKDESFEAVQVAAQAGADERFVGPAVSVAELPAPVLWLADAIVAEVRGHGRDAELILARLGEVLVLQTLRLVTGGGPDLDYGRYWARRALQTLEQNLHGRRDAADVLAPLPLSYRQLSRYMKAQYGYTPKQCQVRARLAEAGQLLVSTDLPITTVAFEVGYSSSQHFASAFKRVMRETPSAYRLSRRPSTRSTRSGAGTGQRTKRSRPTRA